MFIDLVQRVVFDNFLWTILDQENRRNIVNFLNNEFFPDNIAKFIDISSVQDIDINLIKLEVIYRNIKYNLIEFENHYLKIERYKKLKRINEYSRYC
jgi:hypothetical protein